METVVDRERELWSFFLLRSSTEVVHDALFWRKQFFYINWKFICIIMMSWYMEAFLRYWLFVWGNSSATGGFPSQRASNADF